MAQNSEKRFSQIMDKLFKSPKPTSGSSSPSSSSGVELSRGKKRSSPSSALALVEQKTRPEIRGLHYSSALADPSQVPPCRPWDRGDLVRRLATFKSMTWFAKPKVVSAVNCARRGWVNVDMDIITCKACGARLLFSTPPSWTQQQVEKAALVFSLKLDNGHKLLCPWIDNACDEMLAQFPPTTPLELVDRFKERSYALSQLVALPVISTSAAEFMKCPELEEFLGHSMILEYGNLLADISQSESFGNEDGESSAARLYNQAQKLISLCGWETRSLPYVVDCKDKAIQLLNGSALNSQAVHLKKNLSLSAHNADTNEVFEANENTRMCDGVESDPKSVVFDCKLCGASVGLWMFRTFPQPLELFRVVGYTEINIENLRARGSGSENHGDNRGSIGDIAMHTREQVPNLKLTIAGGPPATNQNFKAIISLPVFGRNLRVSHDAEFGNHAYTNQHDSHSKNMISGEIAPSKDMGLLENEKDNQGRKNAVGNQQSSCLEHCATEEGDNLRAMNDSYTSLEETNVTSKESFEYDRHDSQMENPIVITQNVERDSCQDNRLAETAQNVGFFGLIVKDNCNLQAGGASNTLQDANVTNKNGETGQNDISDVIISDNSSRQEIGEMDMVCSKEHSSGETHSGVQASVGAQDNGQEVIIERRVRTPANNKVKDSAAGDYPKQLLSQKEMELDPIRQHRHFCPWISSTGSRAPGWRQTLLALLRKKKSATSSPSLVKVDDPITSVRKLFMSPSAKKLKPSQGSS